MNFFRTGKTSIELLGKEGTDTVQLIVKHSQDAPCITDESVSTHFALNLMNEENGQPAFIKRVKYDLNPSQDTSGSSRTYNVLNLLPGRTYSLQVSKQIPRIMNLNESFY